MEQMRGKGGVRLHHLGRCKCPRGRKGQIEQSERKVINEKIVR